MVHSGCADRGAHDDFLQGNDGRPQQGGGAGFYGLDRVHSGEDSLGFMEGAELGDISQKKVLHLQCHIGTGTLQLVRRSFSKMTDEAAGSRQHR